ncbi:MAG: GNAT family N-acetyltransferase [Solirubrobacteraceae bacterium]
MEVVDLGPLTDAERAQLEGDEVDPFDGAGITLQFRGKDRHVVLRDDGRLVASAGLTEADVEVAGQRFRVAGLGGVIVNADHRGQGLARHVVEAALSRAESTGLSFVVLFCHPDRAGLYERLGFATVSSPVRVQQSHGFEPMTQRMMWRALEQIGSWPEGDVTVYDLPF